MDSALGKKPTPPKRRSLAIPGDLAEPEARTALPAAVQASVDAQRAEVRRRQGIVNKYRELVGTGRPRRGVRRHERAAAVIRRRYGIGLRTLQRYAAWLAGMRPDVRTVLLSTGPLTLNDLPSRCVRKAEQRFQTVWAWGEALRLGKAHGLSAERVSAGFIRRRPGLSISSLYRWSQRFREHGPGGLLDGRSVGLVKIKAAG